MRWELHFPEGDLDRIERELEEGGYQRAEELERDGERRWIHPRGSVVRCFRTGEGTATAYCYPPGGTRNPEGPVAGFATLEAHRQASGFGAGVSPAPAGDSGADGSVSAGDSLPDGGSVLPADDGAADPATTDEGD